MFSKPDCLLTKPKTKPRSPTGVFYCPVKVLQSFPWFKKIANGTKKSAGQKQGSAGKI